MSDILNQQFSENPKRFFKRHFIHQPDALCFRTTTGLQQFDFNFDQQNRAVKSRRFRNLREIPVVSISRYIPTEGLAQAAPFDSVAVYWLRSEEIYGRRNGVTNIQLGNDADFFFTTTINGCRIEVEQGVNPVILHIAGRYRNDRQIQLGNQYFNGARHRGLSYVPDHGYANTDNAIFYGIRNRRTNLWKFYTQGYDAVFPQSTEMIYAGISGAINFKRLYVNKRF